MSKPIVAAQTAEVKGQLIQCSHCGTQHRAEPSGIHHKDFYDCTVCLQSFSWDWSQPALVAVSKAWARACGKCKFVFSAHEDMCPKCNAYQSKIKQNSVEGAWEELMGLPLRVSAHDDFLRLCLSRNQIDWACAKYQEVYNLTGLDFFAQMRRRAVDMESER
ncbi:MAG: hypothetical protein V4736_00980, partial [Bdellovibrionota bacterium]